MPRFASMLSVGKEECGSSKSCIEEKIPLGRSSIILEKMDHYDGRKYLVEYLIFDDLDIFMHITRETRKIT